MLDCNGITLLGFAKTSIATARFLLNNFPAIRIRISEQKARENFDSKLIEEFETRGVEFEFAKQNLEFIHFASKQIVITSPGIIPTNSLIQALKPFIYTDFDFFCHFVQKLSQQYFAVTGTNGKTTTTSLLAHILSSQALGNIGKPFLEMKMDLNINHVIEISSFQLFYSHLESLELMPPKVALYLNFTKDHLDWHRDLNEYWEAKAKLFVLSKTYENFWIINYDDEILRNWALKIDLSFYKTRILFFSTQEILKPNMYSPYSAYLSNNNLILARYDSGQIIEEVLNPVSELLIVGNHNYSNALAAILAAKIANINSEQLTLLLKTFKALNHRLEYLGTVQGHKIYNDSKATNPDSTIRAIDSFHNPILILGGKDKQLDLQDFLNYVSQKAYAVLAIGELSEKISQGLKNFARISQAKDLKDALDKALLYGKSNDYPIVLSPASSSFDMFLNYEDRGDQFKALVQDLLYTPK